eukprot:15479538-Alexandrium_andersonii.AAC.1
MEDRARVVLEGDGPRGELAELEAIAMVKLRRPSHHRQPAHLRRRRRPARRQPLQGAPRVGCWVGPTESGFA